MRMSPFLSARKVLSNGDWHTGADTVTVAIDWRLMGIAMQLQFFVRLWAFPSASAAMK